MRFINLPLKSFRKGSRLLLLGRVIFARLATDGCGFMFYASHGVVVRGWLFHLKMLCSIRNFVLVAHWVRVGGGSFSYLHIK